MYLFKLKAEFSSFKISPIKNNNNNSRLKATKLLY